MLVCEGGKRGVGAWCVSAGRGVGPRSLGLECQCRNRALSLSLVLCCAKPAGPRHFPSLSLEFFCAKPAGLLLPLGCVLQRHKAASPEALSLRYRGGLLSLVVWQWCGPRGQPPSPLSLLCCTPKGSPHLV